MATLSHPTTSITHASKKCIGNLPTLGSMHIIIIQKIGACHLMGFPIEMPAVQHLKVWVSKLGIVMSLEYVSLGPDEEELPGVKGKRSSLDTTPQTMAGPVHTSCTQAQMSTSSSPLQDSLASLLSNAYSCACSMHVMFSSKQICNQIGHSLKIWAVTPEQIENLTTLASNPPSVTQEKAHTLLDYLICSENAI